MAFSVQLNGWSPSTVESGLTARWSSDKGSLCNTGVYSHLAVLSHRGQGDGFLLMCSL